MDGICIIYHDCIDPSPSFVSTCLFIQEFVAGTDLFIGKLGCMASGDPSFHSGLE